MTRPLDARAALVTLEAQLQARARTPHYDAQSVVLVLLTCGFLGVGLFERIGLGWTPVLSFVFGAALLWSLKTDVPRHARGRGLKAAADALILAGADDAAIDAAWDGLRADSLVKRHVTRRLVGEAITQRRVAHRLHSL